MIIYRPRRGRLIDSMKESKEFNDEQEMKEFIVSEWDGMISIYDVTIDRKPSNDDRIGWKDTKYVCTKRFGEINTIAVYRSPQCIGMCATEYIHN